MNQEKIMKARMMTAIIIAIASAVAAFIFAGLYFDQREENRLLRRRVEELLDGMEKRVN